MTNEIREKAIKAAIAAYDAAPGNQNHVWIRAAIDAYEKALWRPIVEAPKDGTAVLLTIAGRNLEPDEDTHCGIGRWMEDPWMEKTWCMDAGDYWHGATHFMPLPAPPEVT
jgi:hypothetical protein